VDPGVEDSQVQAARGGIVGAQPVHQVHGGGKVVHIKKKDADLVFCVGLGLDLGLGCVPPGFGPGGDDDLGRTQVQQMDGGREAET